MIAVAHQLFFERLVIFDYAIMDEGDFATGVKMRMRIFVGDLAVRSPSSVADSKVPDRRFLLHQFGQRCDSAGAFASLDVIAVHDRDPGRVITTIFESPQPIQQDGSSFRRAYITNNSTHNRNRVRY